MRKKRTHAKKHVDEAGLHRILRVNQAGEYGAKRIYAGQLAVLKRQKASAQTIQKIQHMAEQEETHLNAFNKLVAEHQVRPTALQPLWHVAGFALGAATALMGEKAAFACTVAVEEVIDTHYARQLEKLEKNAPLKKLIEDFRADENEHRETALGEDAEKTPLYPVLRKAVRLGSKAAIWLAERV
jgi:ubiquinone biosynthesis monooxygenase Coq7